MSDPIPSFSFADWQRSHPSDHPPGDQLDGALNAHRVAINDVEGKLSSIRRSDGALVNGIVTLDALAPALFGGLITDLTTSLAPTAALVETRAAQAAVSRSQAEVAALAAIAAATTAQADAALLSSGSVGVLTQINAASTAANALLSTVQALGVDVVNDARDAEYWGNYAYSWGQVSWRWAEYMAGPIPADILATMGIAGDHWSSRWWANQATLAAGSSTDSAADAAARAAAAEQAAINAEQAAQDAADSVDDFNNVYLGEGPANPTTGPGGSTLLIGALFFNTTINGLMVWDGSSWQQVTTSSSLGTAAQVSFAPVSNISATNVQAAIQEVNAERVPYEPQDGGIYGRQSGAWVSVVSPSIAWGDITGKPSTFPPSAHTHAQSEITNLVSDLALKASTAALSTETTNRQNADTSLASDITANGVLISTETTNRTNADTSLQTQINAKLGDAPSDGFLYGRKDAAWAKATGAVISDTAPGSPLPGMVWWDSDTGRLYIYYSDGNSAQWVQINAYPALDTTNFVLKTGSTISGQLLLPTPGSGPAAAPKSYVDTGDAAVAAAVPAQVTSGVATAQQAVPSVLAHRNGSGTVAMTSGNLIYKIPMVVMVGQVGGWTINGTGGLVCPKKGVYLLNGSVALVTTAATMNLDIGLQLNAGTVYIAQARWVQGTAAAFQHMYSISRLQFLDVGDVVYLSARSTANGCSVGDALDGTALSAALITAVP